MDLHSSKGSTPQVAKEHAEVSRTAGKLLFVLLPCISFESILNFDDIEMMIFHFSDTTFSS